jgi:glycosyltransferase involved in cell wall biosynthesis
MAQQVKLSTVVIAFNEEGNIARCLDSVKDLTDEIVVVDSFSTDGTLEICRSRGVRVIQRPFEGHVEQKNFALSQATYDHVLSLDADEALSEELRGSIREALRGWACDGYSFNRRTNYCGRWIKHCGWYPDRKLRLWDRRKGRWGGVNPHDHVIMSQDCRIGHLGGDLLHYSYRSLRHHLEQINAYSDIAARMAFERGRRPNFVLDVCLNPPLTFLKKYLLKLGALDGYAGFVISINAAYGKFLKYAKLKDLCARGPENG